MPKLPDGFAPHLVDGAADLDTTTVEVCDNCGAEVTATVAGLCPVCQAETEED